MSVVDVREQPLSLAQAAMLDHWRDSPASSAHHTGIGLLVDRNLDRAAFEEAVRRLSSRHELLRASFHHRRAGPCYLVHGASGCDVRWVDLPDAPPEELERAARSAFVEPFHLDRGAFRFIVFTGRDVTLWELVAHHVATDAQSNALLVQEWMREYADLIGLPDDPAGPEYRDAEPGAYANYLNRQAAALSGARGAELQDRVRERLRGATYTKIPFDRPRSSTDPAPIRTGDLALGAVPARALQRSARECEVSLFSLLLACFEVFLHACTGAEQLYFLCAMTARTSARLRPVVGDFSNLVPFRARVGPTDTIRGLAVRASAQVRLAMDLVGCPYPWLVREGLVPPDHGGRGIHFNVLGASSTDDLLAAMLRPNGTGRFRGLVLRSVDLPQVEGNIDLGVHLRYGRDFLGVELRHEATLLDVQAVQRFARTFASVLAAAAADVDVTVAGCLADG